MSALPLSFVVKRNLLIIRFCTCQPEEDPFDGDPDLFGHAHVHIKELASFSFPLQLDQIKRLVQDIVIMIFEFDRLKIIV